LLTDPDGRVIKVRTPVMELEGLITPVELHYTAEHFGVPEPVPAAQWALTVAGEVKRPLTLTYEGLRRFPGRTVRTVMECSGSDATYFEYFQGKGPKPTRAKEMNPLSASEWTGTPLAAVLHERGAGAAAGPRLVWQLVGQVAAAVGSHGPYARLLVSL
jgi:DMSO/TMAO reductase YedYZ molybdopterin-dependent catalytic subunit